MNLLGLPVYAQMLMQSGYSVFRKRADMVHTSSCNFKSIENLAISEFTADKVDLICKRKKPVA